MSFIYIFDQGTKVSFKDNQICIRTPDEMTRSLPVESVEGVVLFGRIEISSTVVTQFLEKGIPMTWLSNKGKFFGRLESTSDVNIERQRVQFRCGDDPEFVIGLCRQLVSGKIKNHKVFLRRINRIHDNKEVEVLAGQLTQYENKALKATKIDELMGYEGIAAKIYFQGVSQSMPKAFKFNKRSKRPPRDPFNSLLSFGYTLLMYDVYTVLAELGLNPYAGFLHQDRQNHPTLASDLMEEWRCILVDAVVVAMVSKKMIKPDDFETTENGGVYADKNTSRNFIGQYAKKIQTSTRYIKELSYPVSFRRALEHQIRQLIKAMEENDPSIYKPIELR
ncbi:MAG: CRISP-associated protein Cas1 [Eubacteriaceae bacterium]|jgi:CRISPR-associated protein Cas1|nr:CRISP-associated protein Cas1 [Eubacteriaceae bacterium]MDN5306955.1 CRISP-associated protein Cas1 [Eubacteriaceae bacterium]